MSFFLNLKPCPSLEKHSLEFFHQVPLSDRSIMSCITPSRIKQKANLIYKQLDSFSKINRNQLFSSLSETNSIMSSDFDKTTQENYSDQNYFNNNSTHDTHFTLPYNLKIDKMLTKVSEQGVEETPYNIEGHHQNQILRRSYGSRRQNKAYTLTASGSPQNCKFFSPSNKNEHLNKSADQEVIAEQDQNDNLSQNEQGEYDDDFNQANNSEEEQQNKINYNQYAQYEMKQLEKARKANQSYHIDTSKSKIIGEIQEEMESPLKEDYNNNIQKAILNKQDNLNTDYFNQNDYQDGQANISFEKKELIKDISKLEALTTEQRNKLIKDIEDQQKCLKNCYQLNQIKQIKLKECEQKIKFLLNKQKQSKKKIKDLHNKLNKQEKDKQNNTIINQDQYFLDMEKEEIQSLLQESLNDKEILEKKNEQIQKLKQQIEKLEQQDRKKQEDMQKLLKQFVELNEKISQLKYVNENLNLEIQEVKQQQHEQSQNGGNLQINNSYEMDQNQNEKSPYSQDNEQILNDQVCFEVDTFLFNQFSSIFFNINNYYSQLNEACIQEFSQKLASEINHFISQLKEKIQFLDLLFCQPSFQDKIIEQPTIDTHENSAGQLNHNQNNDQDNQQLHLYIIELQQKLDEITQNNWQLNDTINSKNQILQEQLTKISDQVIQMEQANSEIKNLQEKIDQLLQQQQNFDETTQENEVLKQKIQSQLEQLEQIQQGQIKNNEKICQLEKQEQNLKEEIKQLQQEINQLNQKPNNQQFNDESTDLQQKTSQLQPEQKKIDEMSYEIINLNQQIIQQQEQIRQIQDQLNNCVKQISLNEQKEQNLQEKINQLQEQIKQITETYNQQNEQHQQQQSQDKQNINNILQELEKAKGQFKLEHQSLISYEQKSKENQETISALQSQVKQQQLQITEQEQLINNQNQEIKDLIQQSKDEQIKELQSQLQNNQQKVDSLQSEINDHKQQIDYNKQQIDQFKQKITELNEILDEKQKVVKQQQQNLDNLQNNLQQHEKFANKQEKQIKEQEDEIKNLLNQIDEAQQSFQEKEQNLKQQNSSTQFQLEESNQQIDVLKQKLNSLEQQLSILTQDNQNKNKQIDSQQQLHEKNIIKQKKHIENLANIQSQLDSQIKECRKLKEVNNQQGDQLKSKQNEFLKVSEQLKESQKKNLDLQNQNEYLTNQQNSLVQQIQELNFTESQNTGLNQKIQQLESQIQQLIAENDRFKNKSFEQQNQLSQLNNKLNKIQQDNQYFQNQCTYGQLIQKLLQNRNGISQAMFENISFFMREIHQHIQHQQNTFVVNLYHKVYKKLESESLSFNEKSEQIFFQIEENQYSLFKICNLYELIFQYFSDMLKSILLLNSEILRQKITIENK
ncbi:hypothetical protein ABPG72_010254 [Tetrahymena utriculariae]